MQINIPSRLSDAELFTELQRLTTCERETTASLIVHLAEFDARRLYLGAGFSSLFTYCTEVLHLSEHEAYNRIEAARAARRFPLVLDMLGEGSLNLTTVRLLAPHLTGENHQELLVAASHKRKREVEEILARYFPQPAIPSSIRKLPAAQRLPASLPERGSTMTNSAPSPGRPTEIAADIMSLVASAHPLTPGPAPSPTRRSIVRPLASDRYEIRFTANAQTCEKLRLAQDLLRHAVPDGDTAEVIDRALTALLEDLARKKVAETTAPRASRGQSSSSRHVPARVRRAVWLRDGARCAYVAKSGRRCTERSFLEFHHVTPYAAGGEPTVSNIQLRCRAHNAYEAELYFGPSRPTNGEGVVEERGATYRCPTEITTRSGTSCSWTAASLPMT